MIRALVFRVIEWPPFLSDILGRKACDGGMPERQDGGFNLAAAAAPRHVADRVLTSRNHGKRNCQP
jgi:hypothetical protein